MASQLQEFKMWLLENHFFRIARFAKDPKNMPAPEEALAQLPDRVAQDLINAANTLPVPASEESEILAGLGKALAQWKECPNTSPNSIVLLAEPVSSISRVLTSSLIKIRAQNADDLLTLNLVDWIERPADAQTIKQQIKSKLGLDTELEESDGKAPSEENYKEENYNSSPEDEQEHTDNNMTDSAPTEIKSKIKSEDRELMVIPNLCWCFLRSASGLDGLDYMQDLLPKNQDKFWVLGSGIVGWEYLKSTIKFHAYCGETFQVPPLSGEDLQNWLSPIVDQFDIYFLDNVLHKRLQNGDSLLDMDISANTPIAALSEIGQEVTATVQSSVSAIKDEIFSDDETKQHSSSEKQYFKRLAEVSEGVSTVALQIFIKSLRYREVETKQEPPNQEETDQEETAKEETAKEASERESGKREVILKSVSDSGSDSGSDSSRQHSHQNSGRRAEKDTSSTLHSSTTDTKKIGIETEYRVIATTPKLPPLPDLSQNDLYLLYSLMLHGDLTISALAESLGDAPNVVTSQVQMLRNSGIIEQQGNVLKANPAYYPQLRRELDRNNFMIEAP